jgi:hypothetical protein
MRDPDGRKGRTERNGIGENKFCIATLNVNPTVDSGITAGTQFFFNQRLLSKNYFLFLNNSKFDFPTESHVVLCVCHFLCLQLFKISGCCLGGECAQILSRLCRLYVSRSSIWLLQTRSCHRLETHLGTEFVFVAREKHPQYWIPIALLSTKLRKRNPSISAECFEFVRREGVFNKVSSSSSLRSDRDDFRQSRPRR